MNECREYDNFGTCIKGSKCRDYHSPEHVNTEIFAAVIKEVCDVTLSITIERIGVENRETYFLPNTPWHRMGAENGDLVIFQKSDKVESIHAEADNWRRPRQIDQCNIGRIVAILSKSIGDKIVGFKFEIVTNLVQAFTLDCEGTRRHDDASSIEQCQKCRNPDCNKIGIHIIADLTNPNGFEKKNNLLVLSFYFHTTCSQKVSAPTFTLVRISEEYSLIQPPKRKFKILWKYFMDTKSLQRDRNYIASRMGNIEDWKVHLLLGKLMHRYNECAKEYVVGNVITKRTYVGIEKWENCDNRLIVPQDIYDRLQSFILKKKFSVVDLAPFLATSDLFISKLPSKSSRVISKYHREVKLKSDLGEDDIVHFTSPLRENPSKINQQILIDSILSPSSVRYTRDDLLGLLCIRYRNPHLADALLTSVDQDYFLVSYIFNNIKHRLNTMKPTRKIRYDQLHYNREVKTKNGTAVVILKNVYCEPDEYFNQKYVTLNRDNIDDILEDWEHDNFQEKLEQFFEGQRSQPESILYPYEKIGSDTLFTVAPNFRLKLQVSENSDGKMDKLSLRLLVIGTNCHLCLTHIENPDLAFMSDRSDIIALDIMDNIEFLNRSITTGRKPFILRLEKVEVHWDSKFYSGGSFICSKPVGPGDFLCIRQDILDRDNSQYVWVAHAVVKELVNNSVMFSVCTLSQNKSCERALFSVEVIQIPKCHQPET
ncbi:uncharacterized protein LOC144422904 [Styela clava]